MIRLGPFELYEPVGVGGMAHVWRGTHVERQVPMVDRIDARDAIWKTLIDVHQTGRPQAIVLRGQAGTGKSRLAQWMSERAHELGATSVLKTHHGPMFAPGEGLSRILASHLRCAGLKRQEIQARVDSVFAFTTDPPDDGERFDALATSEIIAATAAPDIEASDRRVRFSNPTERYAVIARFIDRLAARRPVVIWLDDVHWSADSVRFVEYFLSRRRGFSPVLFLLTARQEELLRNDAEADALRMLEGHEATRMLAVKPLSEADHLQVVRHLLSLDETLARDVARRTSGNPLFAVQLIGDWVEQGLLESSPQGYRLRPGETATLPDDIHHLLVQRLELLLSDYGGERQRSVRLALELAATLGRAVDAEEWHKACQRLDITPPMDAVETMIAAGLARRSSTGWLFAYDALRESLQRMATDADRWQGHNLTCAHVMRSLYEADMPGINLRLARHFWRAGQLAEAQKPLLEAAQKARQSCETRHTRTLLDQHSRVLDELNVPDHDRRRVLGWIERGHLHTYEARHESADALFCRARDIATSRDWDDLVAESLYGLGTLSRRLGNYKEAQEVLARSREIHRRQGDWLGVAKTTHSLAAIFQTLGDFWDDHFRLATELLGETGFVHKDVACLLKLAAQLAADAGKTVRARHAAAIGSNQWRAVGRPDDALRVESLATPDGH